MEFIRSIKGDIEKTQLGICQCHEHLFIAEGPSRAQNAALYMDDFEKSCEEARMYKDAGGQSFIDAQPYRCGRMAQKTIELCEAVGVNAVCCTGFHKTEFHEQPEWAALANEDEITRAFMAEIMQGMESSDGTNIDAKAGLIKCALTSSGAEADRRYAKLFAAARNAAVETGAPVYVHTDAGSDAISFIQNMQAGGIDGSQIILCHLDRTKYDFGYHTEIAKAGVYLEYDTIHREKYHSNADEIKLINHMIENGCVDKLLLGMDETNMRLKSYGASFGMDYILTDFKYQMQDAGIDEDIFTKIMTENAANALSFKR